VANINDVFGEYDESKPMISFNLPSKEELIAELLGLIPGGRALKNFHDNPEGPISETLSLAAEDVVPFYAAAKNGADVEDILKEAAILGVPMPYIKHPVTGKPIPNNLKEGLGNKGWSTAKSSWNPNTPSKPKKLYTAETLPNRYIAQEEWGKGEGLATTHRVNRNQIAVPAEQVFGPHRHTNTGANIQNQGRLAMNTNTIPVNKRSQYKVNGNNGWQGDMYPPGRSLRKDDFVGPQQWEDKYSRKLDAAIDENEYKWEYLINQTRPAKSGPRPIPKEEIIDIAMKQGRPDIAQRVINDNKPRVPNIADPKFRSYQTTKSHYNLTNEKWKDIGNRAIENELRETFASLPNDPDIRYRFAEHYGVPDLYQSWINDPLPWEKLKVDTKYNRSRREACNRTLDRRYGRNIER
jgi:hypothetical protein